MSLDVPMFCCPITGPWVWISLTSFIPTFSGGFSGDSLSTSTPVPRNQTLILLTLVKTTIMNMISNTSTTKRKESLYSASVDNGGNVRNANAGGLRDLLSLSFGGLLGVFFGL